MEKVSNTRGVIQGILGALFAAILLIVGSGIGDEIGELFAKSKGVSNDSIEAGLPYLIFLIILLPVSFLIYKLLNAKFIVFSKFFFWTFVVSDCLFILIGLLY